MELYVQEDSEDSIAEILWMEMNRLLDIKVIIGLLRFADMKTSHDIEWWNRCEMLNEQLLLQFHGPYGLKYS